LDDVLLNRGEGAVQEDLSGITFSLWTMQVANNDKKEADFDSAKAMYPKWARANRVAHSRIQVTLPTVLHEECAQRLVAHELWSYLEDRFAGQTLVSAAALWGCLTHLKLDDFDGVSAFSTAITKVQMEIERATKEHVPETLLAGTILVGMGTRYPNTKENLLQLPLEQQTKAAFVQRLLNAEKTAQVTATMEGATIGAATPGYPEGNGGCGYVRKLQGRGFYAKPGTKCSRGRHPRNKCFALLDDEWLKSNPGKGPADLPDRMKELREKLDKQGAKPKGKPFVHVASDNVDDNGINAAIAFSPAFYDYSGAVGEEKSSVRHALSSEALRTIRVALDSGATTSCLKEKIDYKPFSRPLAIHGAGKDMVTQAHGTSTIPCPALPSKQLTGVYSPAFRHNLISVKNLQTSGVEVVFPANKKTAECRNPTTGQVLWHFQQGSNGLYEGTLECPTAPITAAQTECTCNSNIVDHSTVLLHHRLGHISESYLQLLVKNQAITGLPKVLSPAPSPFHSSCVPCIEAKTQSVLELSAELGKLPGRSLQGICVKMKASQSTDSISLENDNRA
jgi:hypothetical protein